jgi:NAD(P)-dependent dehydrogenase (short-subunit alcohol dehydrogenase family)
MAVILITGASDGLGRALAEDLAASGRHRLLLHGRNSRRLREVADVTGGETFEADFSSLAEVVNVASIGQEPIDFDDPQLEHEYTDVAAYCRSKLALICHTYDLAEALAESGVTVNSLHPASYMPTAMSRRSGMEIVDTLEKGLAATRRLVDASEPAEITGRYFDGDKEALAVGEAYDPDYRRRLSELTRNLPAKV